MTPNLFAYLALALWGPVALWLYRTRSVSQATIWTILGGFLLLPVGASLKIQGIPSFDKGSIPNLAALAGCMMILRRPSNLWLGLGWPAILVVMFLIGPFITAELNGDPIPVPGLPDAQLPAEGNYDALSAVVSQFFLLLPFFIGRQALRSAESSVEILRALVIAGLIYSIPMLFEIRMSPQLHEWIYGYNPSDFEQEVRAGGYRPIVFLGHGLAMAFFTMTTVVAATALWRAQTRADRRLPPAGVTGYLSLMLVFCRSMGSLVYGAALAPLVYFTKARLQVRVALALVSIALLYPMLRTANLVPTSSIIEFAQSINQDRADSLKQRFDNEELLLQRASERIYFGWGRWGRSRIYNEYGQDVVRSDGYWVILLGQFGLFGFLAQFGLLATPIFRLVSSLKFARSAHDRIYLGAIALILGINVFDLLPNAGLRPWTWLLAGALLGRTEALRAAVLRPRERVNASPERRAVIN